MIAGTEEEGAETAEETEFYHRMMDDSTRRLRSMQNTYKGKDCVVIGGGPSLNKIDFDLIRDKYMFGVTTLYKFFDRLNIRPQFYGLSDGQFFKIYGTDVLTIDSQLFLTRSVEILYLRNYEEYSKMVKREPILVRSLLPEMTESNRFSKDACEGIYSGWTGVIDLGLQIAYHLGFQRAILIGCDCGGGHFFDKYEEARGMPGVGRSGDPNARKWIYCYKICNQAWEEEGREIINATVGGALEVFLRKQLKDLF